MLNQPWSIILILSRKQKVQLSEEQLLEVKEAFNVFDSEQTGGLDAKELKAALTVLNIKLSKEEIRQIYSDLGKDIREKVNYDDFLEIVTPRLPDRHTKDYIRGVRIINPRFFNTLISIKMRKFQLETWRKSLKK